MTAEQIVRAEIAAWARNDVEEVISHFADDATDNNVSPDTLPTVWSCTTVPSPATISSTPPGRPADATRVASAASAASKFPCGVPVRAAVVGLPRAEGGESVAAAVVLRAGAVVEAEALRDFCRLHLTAYKVPKRVVTVDALPTSLIGKVLRREVRETLLG